MYIEPFLRTIDYLTDGEDVSFIICNEFFDALPIHQFRLDKESEKWKEVLVDADPEHNDEKLRSELYELVILIFCFSDQSFILEICSMF